MEQTEIHKVLGMLEEAVRGLQKQQDDSHRKIDVALAENNARLNQFMMESAMFREEMRLAINKIEGATDSIEGHGRALQDHESRLEAQEADARARMLIIRNNRRWARWVLAGLSIFLGDHFTGNRITKAVYTILGIKV